MSVSTKSNLATQIRYALPMFIIAVVTITLDQLTKAIIRKDFSSIGAVQLIKGFLEISYSENTGAAFGMFQGRNSILVIISLFAIAFIFIYYKQFKTSLWMKASLGLLLGGALGNFIDRIFIGYVTDFIRVRIWFLHFFWWPNFNIADAAVCIGAVMLIIGLFRSRSMSL